MNQLKDEIILCNKQNKEQEIDQLKTENDILHKKLQELTYGEDKSVIKV